MDGAAGDLTRAPGEGGVATDTPHLVTAINLGNHLTALRACLGVLRNELCCLESTRITRVRRVARNTLDLLAVRTGVELTDTTLPGAAEKAAATLSRAAADKHIALLCRRLIDTDAVAKALRVVGHVPDLRLETLSLLLELALHQLNLAPPLPHRHNQLLLNTFRLIDSLNAWLRSRQQSPLAVQEQLLAVLAVD